MVQRHRMGHAFYLGISRHVRHRFSGGWRFFPFGLYVDRGLCGQTVEVLIYDEALRIEQAKHLLGPAARKVR
jgi:hypothetical protein